MLIAMAYVESHDINEFGKHDPDDCDLCLEIDNTVKCDCHCGNCCERLIIEVDVEDGEREPRIAAECQPLFDSFEGEQVPIGYRLNDDENGLACRFFDREARLCTIYDTRPFLCRIFNCDEARASEEQRDSLAD